MLSSVWLLETPWTVALQAPLSMGFSRQEYWSGLPCPPLGDLPDPGIKPISLASPALADTFFTTIATWEALNQPYSNKKKFFLKINNTGLLGFGSSTLWEGMFWQLFHFPFCWNTLDMFCPWQIARTLKTLEKKFISNHWRRGVSLYPLQHPQKSHDKKTDVKM